VLLVFGAPVEAVIAIQQLKNDQTPISNSCQHSTEVKSTHLSKFNLYQKKDEIFFLVVEPKHI
jgi:hypothetical protein